MTTTQTGVHLYQLQRSDILKKSNPIQFPNPDPAKAKTKSSTEERTFILLKEYHYPGKTEPILRKTIQKLL